MNVKKAALILSSFLIVGILILVIVSFWKKGCSMTYWLNPDSVCRVHDESGDRLLVEYFNIDTNELLLYIQENGRDVLIEHPYGRVSNYSENVDSNEMKLDRSDNRYIIVNGERFEIIVKK